MVFIGTMLLLQYSALFTYEYICYLSRIISKVYPGSLYRIGIIAPYRAQSDLVEKLLASEKLPMEVNIQVGTIHGFQGDECDIIFAIFNTPPTISASKDMFLNKLNIINVSISRARDYLFVVMPDDDTVGIQNLLQVKRVEKMIKTTHSWDEFSTSELEDMMFGDAHYLENNAFSTSHQNVNVYGLPEKQFEVRTEDNAVDIQIHREAHIGSSFRSLPVASQEVVTRSDSAMSDSTSMLQERPTVIERDVPEEEAVVFYRLQEKRKSCPIDGNALITRPVRVINRAGKEKRINMQVCQRCGRNYLYPGSLPESIHLSDYLLEGRDVGLKMVSEETDATAVDHNTTTVNTRQMDEQVISQKYGKGVIISRNADNSGGHVIKVRFSKGVKLYLEEKALASGILQKCNN